MGKLDFAISARSLSKAYLIGDVKVEVLKDICFDVAMGEFVVICGPSGVGKTTLLNIVSGIDQPSSGEIVVLGQSLVNKDEDFLADFRCNDVGFVFQSYNLVSTLTVAEMLLFPWSGAESQRRR